MKLKEKSIKAMVYIFCFLVFVGTIISVFKPQAEYSEKEKRILETRPELDLESFLDGDFQQTYENYLNDQFFARDLWVKLSVNTEILLGKKDINGVYIGKDGYLLEKYEDSDFDADLLEENIYILSDFLNYMEEEYGKKHVTCMMVPSKATIMEKKLPKYAAPYSESKIIRALKEELETPANLIDLSKVLKKHSDEEIFYRTDHHWTSLGAYYAYTEWAKKTKHKVKEKKDFSIETAFEDFYGTTYNKVQCKVKPDKIELWKTKKSLKVDIDDGKKKKKFDTIYFPEEAKKSDDDYSVFFSGNTKQIVIDVKGNHTGKTLLVIKDSFANSFVPFLLDDYDRIIMLDLRYRKDSIFSVFEEYPDISDILVLNNVEKFAEDVHLMFLEEE